MLDTLNHILQSRETKHLVIKMLINIIIIGTSLWISANRIGFDVDYISCLMLSATLLMLNLNIKTHDTTPHAMANTRILFNIPAFSFVLLLLVSGLIYDFLKTVF